MRGHTYQNSESHRCSETSSLGSCVNQPHSNSTTSTDMQHIYSRLNSALLGLNFNSTESTRQIDDVGDSISFFSLRSGWMSDGGISLLSHTCKFFACFLALKTISKKGKAESLDRYLLRQCAMTGQQNSLLSSPQFSINIEPHVRKCSFFSVSIFASS